MDCLKLKSIDLSLYNINLKNAILNTLKKLSTERKKAIY